MKKIASLLLIITIVVTASCTTNGLKPRTVDQFYVATGIEKYFLPDLPEWANYNQSAACFRSQTMRYFDLDALMKSYTLKYNDALQIQASFNEEYLEYKKQLKGSQVSLKDEEHIFFRSSDKVNSKIVFFDPPTFKQIHLIWLDDALVGKKEEDRLKQFMNSTVHDDGFPVLISMCLSKAEVLARFPDMAVKVISAELFSIYDVEGKRKPNLHINVNTLFKPDQKITFFSQGAKKNLQDIRGNYKTSNY